MVEKRVVGTASGGLNICFAASISTIGVHTIVRLPDVISARLPSRGQVAIKGLLNGQAFQTVLEPDGMRGHFLKVDKAIPHSRVVSAGDTVVFEIEPIKEWPEPEVPEDFQSALNAAPDISATWRSITAMARWEWVRWINATNNPHTRLRRVQVGISKLRAGKRRPCCFNLAACTDPDLSRSGKLMDLAR